MGHWKREVRLKIQWRVARIGLLNPTPSEEVFGDFGVVSGLFLAVWRLFQNRFGSMCLQDHANVLLAAVVLGAASCCGRQITLRGMCKRREFV